MLPDVSSFVVFASIGLPNPPFVVSVSHKEHMEHMNLGLYYIQEASRLQST